MSLILKKLLTSIFLEDCLKGKIREKKKKKKNFRKKGIFLIFTEQIRVFLDFLLNKFSIFNHLIFFLYSNFLFT
jgi:hypothetical protein